jgi:GNAT superfamily N-acetyltransferase
MPSYRCGMEPRLREPTLADAAALGEVHVRAWQVAYRGMFPDDYLDGLDPAERAANWQQWLASPANGRLVAVADNDVPVGFVVYGEWRDDDREAGVGELRALNVHPDQWGTGAGRALLQAADEGLAAMGYHAAILWVVAGNARARRFYEIDGWAPDGASRSDEQFGPPIEEVRYRRPL